MHKVTVTLPLPDRKPVTIEIDAPNTRDALKAAAEYVAAEAQLGDSTVPEGTKAEIPSTASRVW